MICPILGFQIVCRLHCNINLTRSNHIKPHLRVNKTQQCECLEMYPLDWNFQFYSYTATVGYEHTP